MAATDVVVLIPLFFGAFCAVGAATFNKEHPALKIFLYLCSLLSVIISGWLSVIILNEDFPGFTALQDSIGWVVWVFAWTFAIVTLYFAIYLIKKALEYSHDKKSEEMQY